MSIITQSLALPALYRSDRGEKMGNWGVDFVIKMGAGSTILESGKAFLRARNDGLAIDCP